MHLRKWMGGIGGDRSVAGQVLVFVFSLVSLSAARSKKKRGRGRKRAVVAEKSFLQYNKRGKGGQYLDHLPLFELRCDSI